jgi:hypothetical protein
MLAVAETRVPSAPVSIKEQLSQGGAPPPARRPAEGEWRSNFMLGEGLPDERGDAVQLQQVGQEPGAERDRISRRSSVSERRVHVALHDRRTPHESSSRSRDQRVRACPPEVQQHLVRVVLLAPRRVDWGWGWRSVPSDRGGAQRAGARRRMHPRVGACSGDTLPAEERPRRLAPQSSSLLLESSNFSSGENARFGLSELRSARRRGAACDCGRRTATASYELGTT